MSAKAIEMTGVRKAFRFFALDDVSLNLEHGQIMGLVGPNGAGKSTTIRLLMGLLAPEAGEIRLLGHAMPGDQAAAKRDVGFVSDDMRMFPHATLGWHMDFVAAIYPGWDAAYAAMLLKRFNLHAGQTAQNLSTGEHVKALLLLALARRPRLLVLDEPTSGLDPVARHELLTEFMDVLRDDSRSILFSSHNTVDVERISDRITFIDRGRVVDVSDKDDFLDRWRSIRLRLPPGTVAPVRPEIVRCEADGQFATLTTNRFSDALLAELGDTVQEVHRMSLEEIFVATVMLNRQTLEAREERHP
jgi:ABC-2 type transport system ATP-binding protein